MIVLDIGSHNGQTLAELVKPIYTFSAIHAFEPMPNEYTALRLTYGQLPPLHLHNYGLADFTGPAPVYGSNSICEASMYATKVDVDSTVVTQCNFMQASVFFAGLPDEPLVVKMNCEGAEVPILTDLAESGQLGRIAHLTVDFDIRRVAGHEADAEPVIDALNSAGIEWRISGEHFHGDTHQAKIANWLREVL